MPAAREVDVARIERELVALMRAQEHVTSGGPPAQRTAVLNLVAYAADRPTMERIGSTLAALVDHHPSRTIVALVDPRIEAREVDAWVQVECKPMGTTGQPICAERIVLEAPTSATRRLPNAILPLLLADLPVVLWWPGEPPLRDPFLYDMLEPAYRLVVDSTEFTHLERALGSLSGVPKRPGLAVDLVDLNWERMLPWRELIAQFWDIPSWRSQLRGVDRVEIDLARPPGGRSNRGQALLVAGWLSSRLGWTPLRSRRLSDGYDLAARRPGGDVEIAVRISPGERAGLRAVRFHVETERHRSRFEVRATGPDSCEVEVVRDGVPVGGRRVARLESFEEPELIARALDTLQGETIYEEALESAVGFLRASSTR